MLFTASRKEKGREKQRGKEYKTIAKKLKNMARTMVVMCKDLSEGT
jgi:hypothetical protein